MKHFVLEGEHLAPFAEFAHLEPSHHAFLRHGYDTGAFLFSGPQIPAHGGFLVARAPTHAQLTDFLADEPFVKAGKMRFSRIIEFDPVQHQSLLGSWFSGTPGPIAPGPTGAPAAGAEGGNVELQHFMLEGEHLVPFEERAPELVAAHRAFLQRGYDNGAFLFSGPTIPPHGGVLVARARSLADLDALLADEPYTGENVMRFSARTRFNPLQYQGALQGWFGNTP